MTLIMSRTGSASCLWLFYLMLISSTISLVIPDHIGVFNMRGVTGTASLVMNDSGAVRILLDLQGFPAGIAYNWRIHTNGMLYDRQNPCDEAFIGAVYPDGDLSSRQGPIQDNDFSTQFLDNVIQLTGPRAVDGRTLVFEQVDDPSIRVCAQLIANADLITAIATIDTPFAGHLYFRQPRDDPSAVSTVYMDVYDITDPIEDTEYQWQISSNSGLNYDMTQEERCGSTRSDIYDPTNIGNANCDPSDPSTCAIGDLSGKFGAAMVQTVPNKTPKFYVDTNLPLTGSDGIIGKTLVFTTGSTRHVCVQIRELQPKTVTAIFSAHNVSGSMTFSQTSPFDAITISVDIKNLRNLASGYHVHKFPVPLRYYKTDNLPGDDSVSGHFNPYGKVASDPEYPDPGVGTNDQYEVGDISGKFGTLAGLDELNANYTDWNMPLFGKNSIVGRSVIIHKAEAAARWIYGTIGYPSKEVKTVQAVFTSPVVGKIVLRQPINDPLGDTSVWVEVAYSDSTSTTENHNWHIHQYRVDNDYLSEEGRCTSTGGHDNSFNALLGGTYTECTPDNPGRCELGDLTGKLGTFNVPGQVGDVAGKMFWTDTRLPLSGAYSVDGKSFVIHAPERGAPRLACADLLEVHAIVAKADVWTVGPVTGDITLWQRFETDPAYVDAYVEGLSTEAAGWHVHNLPVPHEEVNPCSAESVQGHYNPFEVVYTDGPPAQGTHDLYEVGDLSGKFESFSGQDSYIKLSTDTNLYLFGPRSVVGRSIVIHRDDPSGTRWVCATLNPDPPFNAYTLVAAATFEMDGQIAGTVTLTQTHYGEENFGETTIVVEMETISSIAPNSAEVESVLLDIKLGNEGVCSPDSKVYNPYEVDAIGETYDEGCDLRSQLRCQVGDLVGKHDEFSTSIGRAVYTDINLPLGGRASVLGHMLLLRSAQSDDIYACATITPDSERGVAVTYAFPIEVEYDSYNFRTELDASLSDVELWNIVSTLPPTPHTEIPECQSITFYLIGPNQQDMLADFNQALKDDNLGDYSPSSLCEDLGNTANTLSSSHHLVLLTTLFSLAFYVLHYVHQ